MASIESDGGLLTPLQQLPTSGARAAEVFTTAEGTFLAVPQLARDVPGELPYMNGGDSDIEMPIYRWQDGRFIEAETLPLPGGEDAEYFEIDGRRFLAVAGIRTGNGPYDLDTDAVVYERIDHTWVPLQHFPVFAAKQWFAFSFDSRHFLALAQGAVVDGVVPKHPRESRLFEWNGERFEPFQTFDGQWGYNFAFVSFRGEHYLAYADHVSGSSIQRWNGERFVPQQTFTENGGRAFRFFETDGTLWMLHANLLKHTTLYRFDGTQFVPEQVLGAAGGRELCLIDGKDARYLVRVCFITGTPKAPVVVPQSEIFRWRDDRFELVGEFETSGATDAASFALDGQRYLVVSNSLSEGIRFRTDSTVYRFDG
jgi:EPTP domain